MRQEEMQKEARRRNPQLSDLLVHSCNNQRTTVCLDMRQANAVIRLNEDETNACRLDTPR
jgi:hypothetical protein